MTDDRSQTTAGQPPVAAKDELKAMAGVAASVDPLSDAATRRRVIRWAADRYGVNIASTAVGPRERPTLAGNPPDPATYADFPGLFNAAAPRTDGERLLVAGYWRQIIQSESDLNADSINEILTPMGERIDRVRDVVPALMTGQPRLVIQVGKGRTQQSRRSFRLTTPGIAAVEQALAHGGFGAGE